jgi:heptosyltransferase-2
MSSFPAGDEILVRLPNWVGDAVMATPVLLNLAHHYERLSLLGRAHLLPLFKAFPRVKELIELLVVSIKTAKSNPKVKA